MPPLAHRVIFPLKVALAVTLALSAARALSISDTISATFAALVCTSSVLTTGLRRGLEQLAGSLVGGLATVLALGLGGAPWVLGLSIVLTFAALELVRLRGAHVVAGFTVIYVYSLPSLGGPRHALEVRLVALTLGVASALVVSLVVSAGFYERIFARRLAIVEDAVASGFEALARALEGRDPVAARAAFAQVEGLVSLLGAELADASREAVVRRGLAERLARIARREGALSELVQLGRELARRSEPIEARAALTLALARALRDRGAGGARQAFDAGAAREGAPELEVRARALLGELDGLEPAHDGADHERASGSST